MFTKYPFNEVIYFEDGTTRTLENITRVEQGRWFHVISNDIEYIINPDKVDFIKVYGLKDKT